VTQGGREEWLDVPLPEGDRIVPRTALTWKPVDELQLRFSAGAGYRAPTPAFDQVCCGRRYRGNRGVEIEESTSLGVEATYQTGTRWRVGASLFSTDFEDLIITMATLSTFGQHTYQKVNVAEARQTSASLEGRFGINSWVTTKLSYTWLDAQNDTQGETITAIVDQGNGPEDRTFNYAEIPYTVEHRGAIGFDFRVPYDIALNLAGQYTGPTLIQGFTLEAPEEQLVATDDFWVANVRAEKLLQKGLGLYVGVDNVFDYTQDDLGDLRYDYNWGPLRGTYVYGGVSYRLGQ
jgi:outer membrane receptor for ferrienterochelin and colicin